MSPKMHDHAGDEDCFDGTCGPNPSRKNVNNRALLRDLANIERLARQGGSDVLESIQIIAALAISKAEEI